MKKFYFLTKSTTVALAALLCAAPALGDDQDPLSYLKKLSIEDLLQTTITSVSKRPESLFDAAAAVTVITEEDIRRTGARSIPDVLRLVPGLAVAQIDSSRWEVGSRGFSDYFENKLLVLIDGRSMYTPLYAGVYWNSLDTILEDIERIEVIRGPGATVWGANAVNGVINIITKSSKDTTGAMVSVTYGTHDQPLVSARFGDTINSGTSYRVYAKGFKRAEFDDPSGGEAHDSWQSYRAGMRVDSQISTHQSISVQGEFFKGDADLTSTLSGYLTPPFLRVSEETEDFKGGHFQVNFQHSFSETSVLDMTFYYDGYSRELVVAEENRDTLDLEMQHRFSPVEGHEVVWGGEVRWSQDDFDGTFFTSFSPDSKDFTLWSAFIQDDIELIDDLFWVTLGSKFEHNDFSGFEIQPSVRVRFKPSENHMFWGAISRAVRTPSRSEQDININLATFSPMPGEISLIRLMGNRDFDSEELIAYELGYRWQMEDIFSFDLTTFYNDYDDLRAIDLGLPYLELIPLPPHLIIPEYFDNDIEGESYGVELSTTWQVFSRMKVKGAYSWIDLDLDVTEASKFGTIGDGDDNNFPRHQFILTSYYDVMESLSLDGELYYVDEYENDGIDNYLRFDLQVTWKPTETLELSLGGENIFNSSHQEAEVVGSNITSSDVPSIYWLKATFRN